MDILSNKAVVCFGVERFRDVYDEAKPMFIRHWDEIAKNKHVLKLDPDVETYLRGEHQLLLVTARSMGLLVGYFLWVMIVHPHYKTVSVAEEDLHFLLPEYRRGLTGYLFVKAACQAAEDRGARMLVLREKIGHEHPALLKRLGFKPADIVYTRTVTKG